MDGLMDGQRTMGKQSYEIWSDSKKIINILFSIK